MVEWARENVHELHEKVKLSMNPPRRPASRGSVPPSSSSPYIRPSSSASTRPPSSASASAVRPSSSASSVRPSGSARSDSRATHRPQSRVSARPSTRQSSRLNPLYQTLVTNLTGLTADSDEDAFQEAVEFVSRNLDQTVRPTGSVDATTADKTIRG